MNQLIYLVGTDRGRPCGTVVLWIAVGTSWTVTKVLPT